MILPSWGTVKTYAIGILTVGLGILFGLWKSSQASRAKEKLSRVEAAKESKDKANAALVNGLENEKEVANEKVTDTDIDRFYD